MSLGLGMGALGSRLGQGQARETGTEKSGVSGISLSRAKGQFGVIRRGPQACAGLISGTDTAFPVLTA